MGELDLSICFFYTATCGQPSRCLYPWKGEVLHKHWLELQSLTRSVSVVSWTELRHLEGWQSLAIQSCGVCKNQRVKLKRCKDNTLANSTLCPKNQGCCSNFHTDANYSWSKRAVLHVPSKNPNMQIAACGNVCICSQMSIILRPFVSTRADQAHSHSTCLRSSLQTSYPPKEVRDAPTITARIFVDAAARR